MSQLDKTVAKGVCTSTIVLCAIVLIFYLVGPSLMTAEEFNSGLIIVIILAIVSWIYLTYSFYKAAYR